MNSETSSTQTKQNKSSNPQPTKGGYDQIYTDKLSRELSGFDNEKSLKTFGTSMVAAGPKGPPATWDEGSTTKNKTASDSSHRKVMPRKDRNPYENFINKANKFASIDGTFRHSEVFGEDIKTPEPFLLDPRPPEEDEFSVPIPAGLKWDVPEERFQCASPDGRHLALWNMHQIVLVQLEQTVFTKTSVHNKWVSKDTPADDPEAQMGPLQVFFTPDSTRLVWVRRDGIHFYSVEDPAIKDEWLLPSCFEDAIDVVSIAWFSNSIKTENALINCPEYLTVYDNFYFYYLDLHNKPSSTKQIWVVKLSFPESNPGGFHFIPLSCDRFLAINPQFEGEHTRFVKYQISPSPAEVFQDSIRERAYASSHPPGGVKRVQFSAQTECKPGKLSPIEKQKFPQMRLSKINSIEPWMQRIRTVAYDSKSRSYKEFFVESNKTIYGLKMNTIVIEGVGALGSDEPDSIWSSVDKSLISISETGKKLKIMMRQTPTFEAALGISKSPTTPISSGLNYESMFQVEHASTGCFYVSPRANFLLGIYSDSMRVYPIDPPASFRVVKSSFPLSYTLGLNDLIMLPNSGQMIVQRHRIERGGLYMKHQEHSVVQIFDYKTIVKDCGLRPDEVANYYLNYFDFIDHDQSLVMVFGLKYAYDKSNLEGVSRILLLNWSPVSAKLVWHHLLGADDDILDTMVDPQSNSLIILTAGECRIWNYFEKKATSFSSRFSSGDVVRLLGNNAIMAKSNNISIAWTCPVETWHSFQQLQEKTPPKQHDVEERVLSYKSPVSSKQPVLKISMNQRVAFIDRGIDAMIIHCPKSKTAYECAPQDYAISIIPDDKMDLKRNQVAISPDGRWFTLLHSRENKVYLYESETLKRYSLMNLESKTQLPADYYTGVPESYLLFKFANSGFGQHILIVDYKLSRVIMFELPSGPDQQVERLFPLGYFELPATLKVLNIQEVSETLLISGQYLRLSSHSPAATIGVVRYPLQPSKNLCAYLIRSHLRKNHFRIEDQEGRRVAAQKLVRLVIKLRPQDLTNYPLFSVILYLMNQPGLLLEYSEAVNLEEMFRSPVLLRLFYTTVRKESMKDLIAAFDNFHTRHKRFPRLARGIFSALIIKDSSLMLGDDLRTELLTKVLFAPHWEKFSGELEDDLAPVAVLKSSTEYRNNDALQIRELVDGMLSKAPTSSTDFSVYQTLIPLDMQTGSPFSTKFFQMLRGMDESKLKQWYKPLVYYKWNRIFWFVLGYTTLYWAMFLLVYFYFGLVPDQSGLLIPIVILCSIFLAFELKCLISSPMHYLKDVWNYWDCSSLTYIIIVSFILRNENADNASLSTSINFIRVLGVIVTAMRGITWLRIFRPTRYLMTMVLEVFADIVPFFIILIFGVLLLTHLWWMLPGLSLAPGQVSSNPAEQGSWYSALQIPIAIIFGNAPTTYNDQEFDGVQLVVAVISSSLLALVLLNFLIALISGTFSRIAGDQDLYDIRELLYLICDFDTFFAGMPMLRTKIGRRALPCRLLVVLPEQEDRQALQTHVAESLADTTTRLQANVQELTRELTTQHDYSQQEVLRESQLINQILANEKPVASPEINLDGIELLLTQLKTALVNKT